MITADKAKKISEFNKDYEFDSILKEIDNCIRGVAGKGLSSIGFTDVNQRTKDTLLNAGFILTEGEFTRPEQTGDKIHFGTIISW